MRTALALGLLLAWAPGAIAHDAGTPRRPAVSPPPPAGGAVADVLARVRAGTERYLDIERARADGFVQISGMERGHGVHFMNVRSQVLSTAAGIVSAPLDLAAPPMLIYVPTGEGRWQLVGVEYALPARPERDPFPGATWAEHEASCHYRDYLEIPGDGPGNCPATHPQSGARLSIWHPRLWIAHVWAWHPNPAGPFAAENAYLMPYGGEAPAHVHARGRSGTDVAYSELNHRTAGVFLALIAAASFWQVARRRGKGRRPQRSGAPAVSAVLWIVFGVYLFVRSDPEAWPWGPLGLAESLRDGTVLQHKVLACLPILIGALEALHGYAWIGRGLHAAGLGAIAAVGGTLLIVHLHDGRFHFDAIYAQHALMGLVGLGLAAGLMLSRRAHLERRLRFLWPVLLSVMSLVLLFYSEA